MTATSIATAGTGDTKPLTLADLERVIHVLRAPPEPIGEWMRQQGYPPERYLLVLPLKMREDIPCPQLLPYYVEFSQAADKPTFIMKAVI
jgi:hypothetical protein